MRTPTEPRPRRPLFLAAALVAAALLAMLLAAGADARRTVVKGRFFCDDRGFVMPLQRMNVELWKRGPTALPVEWVGTRVATKYTTGGGAYRFLTEAAEEDYFVRMALRDPDGVHLRDFWGINDWSVDTPLLRNDRSGRFLGVRVFAKSGVSHKCAIWAGARRANREVLDLTGRPLPSRGVEIQADAITAGVPVTPGTSMLWPSDYPAGRGGPGDDSTVIHEFGHVIRHGLDGGFTHFVGDAIAFGYARHHKVCLQSNLGFAFNEGWAQFWARRFGPAPSCERPGDMTTEGNVAAALTELMANCAGGSRAMMLEVLRRNPGRIHSFFEFRDRLGCPVPAAVPSYVISAEAEVPPPPELPKARAGFARDERKAAFADMLDLRGRLKAAIARSKRPPPCVRTSCKRSLLVMTRPAVLAFELRMARIQRDAAAPFDSPREQRKLARLGVGKLLRVQEKRLRVTRKRVLRAATRGVRAALRAGRPIFRRDDSKFTRAFRADLARAYARFRRAKRNGASSLPGSLALSPRAAEPLRRTKRRPDGLPAPSPLPNLNPLPSPPPAPPPPSQSSLGFTQCPAEVVAPKAIEVAGALLPAVAGSPVEVTFSFDGQPPVSTTAITDGNGNWTAAHTPSENFVGEWTVSAAFAGDASRLASQAPACLTAYEPD